LRQPRFFFLPNLVEIGKHVFQFGKIMSLRKMIRVIIQISHKQTVVGFPIGVNDFHAMLL